MANAPDPAQDRRNPARFADMNEASRAASAFDLKALPAGFTANPFPIYNALRDHAPVHRMASGGYFLSRHADCAAVYKDAALYISDKRMEFGPKFGNGPLFAHHTTSLVFNDPPLHTRVRRLIAGALAPRAVAGLESALVELVDDLLDDMAAEGEVDLIEDFAAAVPIEVIGNMLAIPHEEREPLRGWSLAILGALEPTLSPDQFRRGEAAVRDFLDYLTGLVAGRRRRPGDPDHDILTRLIVGDSGSEPLAEAELLHNIIFILNAGHETTTNLIGNGLDALWRWPDERQRLIANPGLIGSAVEEILRYESPNQLGNRLSTASSTIGGVEIPAGSFITLGIGAANRDPLEFADADRLDVARDPNRHLAFGSGPHVCAGLAVARMEGRIAIRRFLARFPRYVILPGAVRGGRARFRGFTRLPARLL